MTQVEQLARIAKATGADPTDNGTRIVRLDKGMSIWFWLCPAHLKEKLAAGWALMEKRNPPHKLECDECRVRRFTR